MAATTGMSICGNMSAGIFRIVDTPIRTISIANTMNVYGLRRARRTIHMASLRANAQRPLALARLRSSLARAPAIRPERALRRRRPGRCGRRLAACGMGGRMTSLEGRELVVLRGGRRILDGASIRVRPGEAVAIQGPSGSGKSTLVRLLATLLEADAGNVLLDGRDAREIAPSQFRTRIAFLAQQPAMFDGTVRDNLAAGPALHGDSLDDARARDLIAAVGLDDSVQLREARTLSGGEKQRVALARALANGPQVLLL